MWFLKKKMERNMKVSFEIKLKAKDIFGFNIYQSYRGMQGIISIILPILLIVMAVVGVGNVSIENIILYIVLAVVCAVYIPVTLWLRAQKSMKVNESLAKPLRYEFSEELIRVSQEDAQEEFQWDIIYKMVANKKRVLIYTNRINAFIIPREQLGDKYEDLAKLANACLEKYRVNMK